MLRSTSVTCRLFALCAALALTVGCGGDVNTDELVAQVNSSNIQRLANLYLAYQSDNEWRGPADEAAFKAYIRGFDAAKLKRIGVEPGAVDALFTSERDGQPFEIRYSVAGSAMGSSEPVVFESAGVNGKRQVGFLNMTQREVAEAAYQSLWAGKAKPADVRRER